MKQTIVLNQTSEQNSADSPPGAVHVYVTDRDRRCATEPELSGQTQRAASFPALDLNPGTTFQEILGFGVALTDAAWQDATAETMISRNSLSNSSPFAIADLSAAYSRDARSLHRGVALLENRGVLIQDEISWRADSNRRTVRWQMVTDAEITLAGAEATLTKNGKCLRARILSPLGARFAVASPQQEEPQNPNPGLRQLVMEHSGGGAKTQIAVLLFTQPFEMELRELESW